MIELLLLLITIALYGIIFSLNDINKTLNNKK
jgi:hypothetical protein